MAKGIIWWQRPQLHREEEEKKERRVSWLDLFADLIFVVVIAELAHYIDEISWASIGGYLLLFIPCWWVWIAHTIYTDRFEQDDVSHRLYVFAFMLGVIALALNIHYGTDKTAVGFALSYAFLRVVTITMWLRGGWHNPIFRPVSNRYAVMFSISLLLWVTSIFVPAPLKFVLWGIGLFFDLYAPIITLKFQRQLPKMSTSRLPERFGLFVIIVLGEAVVSVVSGAAELKEISIYNAIVNGLGFAMAFGFWWIYFDQIQSRRPKTGIWWGLLWNYMHLPLLAALTSASTSILKFIQYEGKPLPDEVRWLMCGSLVIVFLSLAIIEIAMQRPKWDTNVLLSLRFISAGAAFLLGLLGAGLNNLVILIILIILGLSQMSYGAYLWFKLGEIHSESPL
jgi:low temperature requirement protein LtrA